MSYMVAIKSWKSPLLFKFAVQRVKRVGIVHSRPARGTLSGSNGLGGGVQSAEVTNSHLKGYSHRFDAPFVNCHQRTDLTSLLMSSSGSDDGCVDVTDDDDNIVDLSTVTGESSSSHPWTDITTNIASSATLVRINGTKNVDGAESVQASTSNSNSNSNSNSYGKRNNFLVGLVKSNWLVLGEILVIILAKYNPALGATGGILRPEITISKIGVFTIFFINGVALSLGGGSPAEISTATKTNVLIQGFNFGFIPLVVKLLAKYYPEPAFRYTVQNSSYSWYSWD